MALWTTLEIENLSDGYVKGMSLKQLSREMNRSTTALNKALTRFGIRQDRFSVEKRRAAYADDYRARYKRYPDLFTQETFSSEASPPEHPHQDIHSAPHNASHVLPYKRTTLHPAHLLKQPKPTIFYIGASANKKSPFSNFRKRASKAEFKAALTKFEKEYQKATDSLASQWVSMREICKFIHAKGHTLYTDTHNPLDEGKSTYTLNGQKVTARALVIMVNRERANEGKGPFYVKGVTQD